MKLPYTFFRDLEEIERRRDTAVYLADTGDAYADIKTACNAIANDETKPKTIRKAEILSYIFDHAQLEISPCDLFADRINAGWILPGIRWDNWYRVFREHCGAFLDEAAVGHTCGAYSGDDDYGHTCPDWRSLMALGLPGVLKRAEDALAANPENDFYESCVIAYRALIRLVNRFADAAERFADAYPTAALTAAALRGVAAHKPETLHEAMQLTFLIFRIVTDIEGENVRSLGRLDVLYQPYITEDDEETKELLRYCFCRYYVKSNSANIPFTLGGEDVEQDARVMHLTGLMVDVLGELNNPSPKVQMRVGDHPDPHVLRRIMELIRAGSNSFVFCNDRVVEGALVKNGHDLRDARDYVMIGCYESSTMGRENACTCNGRVSLPKAVECAMNGGRDLRNNTQLGPVCADTFDTFEDFFEEVCNQAKYFAERSMSRTVAMEELYMEVNPSPLLSGSMQDCIDSGKDIYAGGTKYNFSSVNIFGTATAADALAAIRSLVYEDKRLTFARLREILASDWEGEEKLRLYCRNKLPKYGCGDASVDVLAKDLLGRTAAVVNGTKNGRGGTFRAGAFSIDWRFDYGSKCAASADGRHAGETLSKNMCASDAADRNGVTGVIESACAIDYSVLSNGTVLDLVLHETAIRGEDGLKALEGLLRVYLEKGGLAIQFNVFDPKVLRDAQADPAKYGTLQVRVCGWNALFVNLSKKEQDEFIAQAERA